MPHQGARESRAQGEVAQGVGCPGAVRYARCGTPKQEWALCERCSQEATGELLEIERLTSSLERGHWKSTRQGNSLVAYSTARPVLNGGREETYRKVTRLAPTQLESSMKAWPSPHQMKTAVSAIFVGMWICQRRPPLVKSTCICFASVHDVCGRVHSAHRRWYFPWEAFIIEGLKRSSNQGCEAWRPGRRRT